MVIKKFITHETLLIAGGIMIMATLAKLLGFVEIDSDWFWFIAGLALILEGAVELKKERKFRKKYKILTLEEYKKLKG